MPPECIATPPETIDGYMYLYWTFKTINKVKWKDQEWVYTGITKCTERRWREHMRNDNRSHPHGFKRVASFTSRSEAHQWELAVKKLSHKHKMEIYDGFRKWYNGVTRLCPGCPNQTKLRESGWVVLQSPNKYPCVGCTNYAR